MNYDNFWHLYTHGNLSIISKFSSCNFVTPSVLLIPAALLQPQTKANTDMLSVTIDQLKYSGNLYRWNQTIYIVFCLLSFSIIILRLIHVAVCIYSLFISMAESYSTVWIYHSLCIQVCLHIYIGFHFFQENT